MISKKKILITGFPHCGTSILKTKLGECSNVYEQTNESVYPEDLPIQEFYEGDKQFFLWKDPVLRNRIPIDGYSKKNEVYDADTIIISIIRNPYYVFTSQIKRGLDPFTSFEHLHTDYLNAARVFLDAKDDKYTDVYCIRYEDMFDDNYSKIKSIMDNIGLVYDDDIFEKKTKVYSVMDAFEKSGESPNEKPDPLKRPAKYRYWQINQKFQNFNEGKEINIPSSLENILRNSDLVTQLGYNGQ